MAKWAERVTKSLIAWVKPERKDDPRYREVASRPQMAAPADDPDWIWLYAGDTWIMVARVDFEIQPV